MINNPSGARILDPAITMTMRRAAYALLLSVILIGTGVSRADETFSLDLRDTDIAEFVSTVSELTGKTIVMDPRVKGTISLRSPEAVTREELYEIFLVQLGVNGFAVVNVGDDILKVVPQQAAKLEGVEVQGADSSGPASSDNIVTRVVQVNNVDVEALVPMLRPLVDNQTGLVAPYPESNVLLITDKESNVRRLLEVVVRIDRNDTDDAELVALDNAAAQEVAETLASLIDAEMGGSGSGPMPAVIAEPRTNSVLIRGSQSDRTRLRRIVEELDSEVQRDSNTRVHYLKYAKAKDLAEVLQAIQGQVSEENAGESGGGVASSASVHIRAHEATNSIVLNGNAQELRSLEELIQQLDIRRAQVMVEAIIVEISESRARELGVQWLASGASDGNPRALGGTNFNNLGNGINALAAGASEGGDALTSLLSGIEGLSLGVGRINRAGVSFGLLLKALQEDSESNILSTPSLLTMDNQEASILVGQEVPVVTGRTIGDNNSNPFQTIERKEIGIKLRITPQVNEGSAVQLNIEQEVSSLSGLSAADIITDKRQIQTAVMVDDGATIVLGGLIDDNVQEGTSRVPVLGSIPLIGRLFRSDQSRIERRNLMVFMRPTIVRDQQSLTELSSNKYGYIRARQMMNGERGVGLFGDEEKPVLPEWTGMGPSSFNLGGTGR